jgi:hypothetical protein
MKQFLKHLNFLKMTAFSIMVAAVVITSSSSFTTSPTAERYYKVAAVGQQQIPAANRAKLLSAFRAHYGANASVKEIRLVERGGRTWLVFLGGGDGTPTVGIKLEAISGFFSIDLGGPVGINTCTSQGNCSCCNIECACSAKNGGQDPCGTDACKSDKTDELLPSAMKTVLAG